MRIFLLIAAFFVALSAPPAQAQTAFDAAAARLVDAKRGDIGAIAADIAATGDARAFDLLSALLDGRLYTRKSDDALVLAERVETGFRIADALTGDDLGEAGRRAVKKIGINNKIRGELRGLLGGLRLSAPTMIPMCM